MPTAAKKIFVVPKKKLPLHFIGLIKNPIDEVYKMMDEYGDIFTTSNKEPTAKEARILFVNHPDYIKHILRDKVENYSRGQVFKRRKDFKSLEDFLGNGIFFSETASWEEQHKMLKIVFSKDAILQSQTVVYNEVKTLISNWNEQLNTNASKAIDIETPIHLMMLKILFKTQIIQTDDFAFEEVFNTFQSIMKFSHFKKFILTSIKSNFYSSIGLRYKINQHEPFVNKLNQIVDALIQSLQEKKYECGTLTAALLEQYNAGKIEYKEVRDEIMNFIFAGFETTAASITWALYSLATNAVEQEKVLEELNISNAANNWNNAELPYLKKVIKEAMRLYPPVWFYVRECLEDDMMDGYEIKKGMVIFISSYALHRHKNYWENPLQFNPENFEPVNFKGKNFVYIPFGQGARMCLGQALAGMQMQIILPEILKSFQLSPAQKKHPAINPAIIIKGVKPVQLKVAKRNTSL